MRIKRFAASTMRQALRQVRDEQGPDAVILSNRSIDDGVEIVAAVDYDESLMNHAVAELPVDDEAFNEDARPSKESQEPATAQGGRFDAFLKAAATITPPPPPPPVAIDLANDPTVVAMRDEISGVRTLLEDQLASLVWGEHSRANPHRAALLRQLSGLGLDADMASKIAERTLESVDDARALTEAMTVLSGYLPATHNDPCDEGGVFAVVGPTGVGKTTSIAKLAAQFALKHGRDALALVSTDSFRIGAQEQLATFAQILDVPVHMARDRNELQTVLLGMTSKRLVLIDTAGVSQRDESLDAALAVNEDDAIQPQRLLALPANVQRETQNDVIRRFNAKPLNGLIVTKIDEAASFGATFSALLRHDVPLAYLTDGQRVPEDLHLGGPKRQWWVNEALRRHTTNHSLPDESQLARQFSEVIQHAHA